ncbi:MAG: hypothetical protein ACI90U_000708 [Pseudomonadales bacterium]|jgi:hypothetical protein
MKIILLVVTVVLLTGCSQLDSLLWLPKTTPQQWCESMPCVEIFDGIIFTQPTSTLLVYALGLLWLWAGWRFWQTHNNQQSRRWWAIAMLMGGLAALSAGTSYQSFGYELKCVGQEYCQWTSWWEIAYLLMQIASMNAMLIAVAYSSTTGKLRSAIIAYAWINTILYYCVTGVGIAQANRFMISFEMLVLFSSPAFTLYFIINGWNYFKHKSKQELALLGCWVIMSLTNAIYFAYLLLGYTQVLWAEGIWFSENDVLHVFVMLWVFYVGLVLVPKVKDADDHGLTNRIGE